MRFVVWLIVLGLAVAHQDVWNWEDKTLVFGFVPVTLAYHAGISASAAVTWFLATKFAWPRDPFAEPEADLKPPVPRAMGRPKADEFEGAPG
ncbi:MAG: hypothetical protein AAGJ97_01460 [Planctomycetota bacterium]